MSNRASAGPVAADPSAITIVAADDHPLYLKAMRETLEADPSLCLVAVASDGKAALELILEHRPQVAVLDLRMPELDGREVVRRMRRSASETRALFVSEYHAGEVVLQALTAGAAGFLSKAASGEEIRNAIRRIASGESVLPADVGTGLASTLRERGAAGTHLSPRELTILELMADGGTAQIIAERLHLAVPTVKTHIQNLYAKLGVNDRGAAVAEGMRRGLLS